MATKMGGLLMGIGMATLTMAGIPAAQAEDAMKIHRLDDVVKQYSLKKVDQLPDGVVPIRIESQEELEQMLGGTGQTRGGITTMGTTYGTVSRSCSTSAGMATWNVWADIKVGSSGSFRWIESVLNTRQGLTGTTFGLASRNEYSYVVSQSANSVTIKGGAIVDAYLLINTGMTVLWSAPVECSFTYSIR